MTDLRTAAQQALEACEQRLPLVGQATIIKELNALRAALEQERAGPTGKQDLQVESVATVAENATTQQRVGDAPPSDYRRGYWDGFAIGKREGRIEAEDAALAQEQAEPKPMHPELRKMWEELAAMPQQAEPLNLSDRAVQRRLAAQWGYVPAQAEPVQEQAFHGFMSADGTQVDLCFTPSAPRSDGTYATAYYTAPPRRTMVPLTEGEIDRIHLHLSSTVGSSYKTVARAIEKASWEKNHG